MTLLALQLLLPLALLAWLAFRPLPGASLRIAQALATLAYVVALLLAGLWLSLPWWTPYVYVGLVALALLAARRAPRPTTGWSHRVAAALLAVLGIYSSFLAGTALAARRIPAGPVVDLDFPLRGGVYLVANGGTAVLVNSHADTLDLSVPRRRAYHGQSYGIDLVKLDAFGRQSSGLQPADPERYEIFGEPVYAPCAGVVLAARDGLPDMRVPEMDEVNLPGNHVILRCAEADVLLAHFRRGSIDVSAGQRIERGSRLAQAGNSGRTGAPHLHIHAQTPGSAEAPFSGKPLPMRFDGRFLVRNDRVG